MAVVKFSQNGLSVSGGGNPHPTGNKRGNVTGWSKDSARRNTRFLQSIIPDDLTGDGFALTLTLRDIPPTDAHWRRIHQAFLRTVRNTPGFLRCHCLMELQRRGAPHLHMALYFDPCADNAHYVRLNGEPVSWFPLPSVPTAVASMSIVEGGTDARGELSRPVRR